MYKQAQASFWTAEEVSGFAFRQRACSLLQCSHVTGHREKIDIVRYIEEGHLYKIMFEITEIKYSVCQCWCLD